MRVTIIGLGKIGHAFAGRALDKGHEVTVWNRTAGVGADLDEAGATRADSIADACKAAEVVHVVVADDAAVEAVCLGPDGVLSALGPDGVLANHSTVSPGLARRLAADGPDGRVLDAPVMGSPSLVAEGGSRLLIGGDETTVNRLAPLWDDLAAGYTYCGGPGTGATVKILSNLQLVVGVTAMAEGIRIARAHGLPDELVESVFGGSPVTSKATQQRLGSLLSADHDGWFPPYLARKDVRLAVALATEGGVPVELGPATDRLLTTVVDSGTDWPDFTAVIEALAPGG
ncbi:MAG TPA: NAD(P)-dependent oxidoreductase [Mycobacteriales bacterium]|nr:NAD(P)-dependent oxidoreductase [Mycobacteriales bacterium]